MGHLNSKPKPKASSSPRRTWLQNRQYYKHQYLRRKRARQLAKYNQSKMNIEAVTSTANKPESLEMSSMPKDKGKATKGLKCKGIKDTSPILEEEEEVATESSPAASNLTKLNPPFEIIDYSQQLETIYCEKSIFSIKRFFGSRKNTSKEKRDSPKASQISWWKKVCKLKARTNSTMADASTKIKKYFKTKSDETNEEPNKASTSKNKVESESKKAVVNRAAAIIQSTFRAYTSRKSKQ